MSLIYDCSDKESTAPRATGFRLNVSGPLAGQAQLWVTKTIFSIFLIDSEHLLYVIISKIYNVRNRNDKYKIVTER